MRVINFIFIVFVAFFLSGCATAQKNSFQDFAIQEQEYKNESLQIFANIQRNYSFKYNYKMYFPQGKEAKKLKGVPSISNDVIIMPETFLAYVYKNYYNDRLIILTCVLVHEMSHREFNLPSKPPKEHVQTDIQAIQLLGGDEQTVQNFCKTLKVVQQYWVDSKGLSGSMLNIGWNLANVASLAYGGPAFFHDWLASDAKIRRKLLIKHFHIKGNPSFIKSSRNNQ